MLAGTVAAVAGPAVEMGPGRGISDGVGERRGAAAASVACLPVLNMTVESGDVVPSASTTHAEQPTTPSATNMGRRLGKGRCELMPVTIAVRSESDGGRVLAQSRASAVS